MYYQKLSHWIKIVKACSSEANMIAQHHPTLLDAKCWPHLNTTLDCFGLNLDLLKTFVQQRTTLWVVLAATVLHGVGFVWTGLALNCYTPDQTAELAILEILDNQEIIEKDLNKDFNIIKSKE